MVICLGFAGCALLGFPGPCCCTCVPRRAERMNCFSCVQYRAGPRRACAELLSSRRSQSIDGRRVVLSAVRALLAEMRSPLPPPTTGPVSFSCVQTPKQRRANAEKFCSAPWCRRAVPWFTWSTVRASLPCISGRGGASCSGSKFSGRCGRVGFERR